MSAVTKNITDGWMTVTLENPPRNQVSRDVISGLHEAIAQAGREKVRALALMASGDVFSHGADVKMFQGMSPGDAEALLGDFMVLIHDLEDLPCPTLAIVHGDCFAGGFELVLACDMIWASEKARFAQSEAMIGAMPFGGGVQRLAQRAGSARAFEIVYSGGIYTAQDFERWNIVNQVLPAEDLVAKSSKFIARLARSATLAHAGTKQILRSSLDEGIRSADKKLPALGASLFSSTDLTSGVSALLAGQLSRVKFLGK